MNIQQLTYIVEIANCKSISHKESTFRLAARSVPADPESGKGTGIPRISQDKQRTGTYRKRECFLPKSARNAKRLESF